MCVYMRGLTENRDYKSKNWIIKNTEDERLVDMFNEFREAGLLEPLQYIRGISNEKI